MHQALFASRIEVAVVAAAAGLVYVRMASHQQAERAATRYVLGACGFLLAALAAFGILSPVVAYSILCFCLATVFVVDAVQDERVRRRRIAILSPRPVADIVPAVWVAITLFAILALIPYLIAGTNSAAAFIAGICAIGMAAVAWRIASAPLQLTGEDPNTNPQSQLLCERADRARRAGLACVVALGSIAFFLTFASAPPSVLGRFWRLNDLEMFALWACVWIWQALYVRRLYNSARVSP